MKMRCSACGHDLTGVKGNHCPGCYGAITVVPEKTVPAPLTQKKHAPIKSGGGAKFNSTEIEKICDKYLYRGPGFFTGEYFSDDLREAAVSLLDLPGDARPIAYVSLKEKMSRFFEDSYGLAICDTGLFWNTPGVNTALVDFLSYSDFGAYKVRLLDVVFDNGKKIDISNIEMKKGDFEDLLSDLCAFATGGLKNAGSSVSQNNFGSVGGYSEFFEIVIDGVIQIISKGKMQNDKAFFHFGVTSGVVMGRLNAALPYLRRPENEAQIDNFLDFYAGKTLELTSDEFPVFGYATDMMGTGKKGWVCTNKGIYRSKRLVFGLPPVIGLTRIKRFTGKEEEGKMRLHYGFLKGKDTIRMPVLKSGIFFHDFHDVFREMTAIFNFLIQVSPLTLSRT